MRYLTSTAGGQGEKNDIYRALIALYKDDPEPMPGARELGFVLLWLGLCPGLEHTCRRELAFRFERRSHRDTDREDERARAEDDVLSAFISRLEKLDLASVTRIAGTLVWSTARDVMRRRRRRRRREHDPRFVSLQDEPEDAPELVVAPKDFSALGSATDAERAG